MNMRGRFFASLIAALVLLFLRQAGSPVSARAETLQWMRTYNGVANGTDVGLGVAVAANGGVYVTGYSRTAGQDDDLLLRKYSPTGALLWMQTYNGEANGVDGGLGVTVGPDGSIYVTGRTEVDGHHYDLLLRKYSPDGALAWMRTYNRAANGQDEGLDVAVAPDGSIYVTGFTDVTGGGFNYDLLLRKYSPSGALRWMRTYNGGNLDAGDGVVVAQDGSIYVTGSTKGEGESCPLLLRKYSPTGGLLWTTTYNYAMGKGLAISADGNVYVAGYTGITLYSWKRSNLLLRKYSPSGAVLWTKTYNGAANGQDGGVGVTVARDGSIYVTGWTRVAGQSDNLLLRKYR